ncbi:MAG: FAD-dependent monooxygenase [Mariniblastus sp.]|nr:FAD-dependent monooxygenase [Mariniblastus sp.]
MNKQQTEIGVVGGSISGLATAMFLKSHRCHVSIFERSNGELSERGAGIALDPEVVDPMGGVAGHPITGRVVIGGDGRELWQTPIHKYMTAWSLVYRQLRSQVSPAEIHAGTTVTKVDSDADKAFIYFSDGSVKSFDYVIGADGLGSTVRHFVCPEFEPSYCGYVAIRGMVREQDLPPASGSLKKWADSPGFVNCFVNNSHVTAYWIPSSQPSTSERVLNWMWYRNCPEAELEHFLTDRQGKGHRWSLPPGQMSDERRSSLLAEMSQQLPEPFAATAQATETLFEQAIYKGVPDRLTRDRVALVGDAGHIAVPHIGAGVSLGIQDAMALAVAFKNQNGTAENFMKAWGEKRHAKTKADLDVAARIGSSLQFGKHDYLNWTPKDFDNWWKEMVAGHHLYFED